MTYAQKQARIRELEMGLRIAYDNKENAAYRGDLFWISEWGKDIKRISRELESLKNDL